jgi:hypothetical protein
VGQLLKDESMEKTVMLFSTEFAPAGEAAVDGRKRISIGRAIDTLKNIGVIGDETAVRFAIYTNQAGQILLSPEISVPLYQAWEYQGENIELTPELMALNFMTPTVDLSIAELDQQPDTREVGHKKTISNR